jgi:PAS domain S-box-containing protein
MEITKLRSQLFIVLEQASASLERGRNSLGRVRTGVADTLPEALRSSERALRNLQASFLAAAVFTNGKIAKLRPQLAIASERAAARFQSARSALAGVETGIADGLLEALRATRNALHRLYASFLEAIFAIKRAIANCGSKLFAALKQVAVPFQSAHSALARMARSVIDRPRRLEEARLARENDLQTLLASSADAIIVTNSDRRLVAANSQALELFGVSELNMSNFTISTFVSQRQILDFDRNHSPFNGSEERHGKCKIRRLDGSVWVAECIFVANVVPRRNLYRFVNFAPQKITQWRSPASYTEDARSQHHKAG